MMTRNSPLSAPVRRFVRPKTAVFSRFCPALAAGRRAAAHAAGLTMDELAARPATPLYLRPPDATLPDPQKTWFLRPLKMVALRHD